MAQTMYPSKVNANGEVRLPKPVRAALHLRRKGALVGFVVVGGQVRLTKATVVPDSTLSEEEVAYLARLSKRATGTRTFRTQDAALRHLWSL